MITQRSNSIAGKLYRIIMVTALVAMITVSFPIILVFSSIIRESALDSKINLMHEIMNQVDFNIRSASAESRRIQLDHELDLLLAKHMAGEDVTDDINIRLNSLIAPLGIGYRSVLLAVDSQTVFDSITRVSDIERSQVTLNRPEQGQEFYFSSPLSYDDSLGNPQTLISYVTDFRSTSGIVGQLVINLDFSVFESIFKSVESEVDQYAWVDYDNQMIFAPADPAGSISADQIRPEASRQSSLYFDDVFINRGRRVILIYSKSSSWILAASLTNQKLLEQYNWFILYYLISIVVIVMIILASVRPLMRRQLKPLGRFSEMMKELSTGNLNMVSDIRTSDELESLSQAFNTMAQQLRYHIARTVEDEKDKERLRYSLLISQINPHFVCNTLNIMTYLARQKQPDDIVVVNSALIKILRDSLRIDDVQFLDKVSHEMDIVDQNVTIQHFRYGDQFSVTWDVEEDALQQLIPKSLIQPLVENALFHGLLPCEDPDFFGRICISIRLEGANIRIEVTDNGIGMSLERLNQVRRWISDGSDIRGCHVGLRNIIGRMNYLYGSRHGQRRLEISSGPAGGTQIVILLDHDVDIKTEEENEST